MSKAALDHFTKTMAHSLQAEGVRVNSINPATVRKLFQVFFSIIISVKNLMTEFEKNQNFLGFLGLTPICRTDALKNQGLIKKLTKFDTNFYLKPLYKKKLELFSRWEES